METNWLYVIRANLNDLPKVIQHYESELEAARREVTLRGSVEKHSRDMPGIVELRFRQLQEIETILEYLNIELRKLRSATFRKYLEKYNRQLSSRDAEKYVDGEADVVDYQHIVNEVALLRNKYIAVTKSLDTKQWQITNIVKLRAAGLEDIQI